MADYSVVFSGLDALLQSLAVNTADTPYEIEITEITNAKCTGASTAQSGTVQYVLQQNTTKFVSLSFATDSGLTQVGNKAFYQCPNLIGADFPSVVTSIGSDAFRQCINLTQVNLPSAITKIPNYCFYYCQNLESVTIPDGVTQIGIYAFYKCESLESIVIPNGVYNIGDSGNMNAGVFQYCSELKSVEIPATVSFISGNSFLDCTDLSSVNYKGTVKQWCNISFENAKANPIYYAHKLMINDVEQKNLVIPDTTTTIKKYAFFNCTSLESVDIPASVTIIRELAFSGCTNLSSVNYSGTIAQWCNIYFYKESSEVSNPISYSHNLYINGTPIVSLTLPDTVTTIRNYAFYGCQSITSVYLPDSVTNIGVEAFCDCTNLRNLRISENLATIQDRTFSGCAVEQLVIPSSVRVFNSQAFAVLYNLRSVEFKHKFSDFKLTFSALDGMSDVFDISGYPELTVILNDDLVERKFYERYCDPHQYVDVFPYYNVSVENKGNIIECNADDLSSALEYLDENTASTPYTIKVTEIEASHLLGDDTAESGTIQYALQQNGTKFLSIEESDVCYKSGETITSMAKCFKNCTNLVGFSGVKSTVTDIDECFYGCINLSEVN